MKLKIQELYKDNNYKLCRNGYGNLTNMMNYVSGDNLIGVEAGVAGAASSFEIVDTNKFNKYYMIDPFSSGFENWEQQADEIISLFPDTMVKLRMTDSEALNKFDDESIDFFYYDHDHSKNGCLNALKRWIPKVKPNGYIGGHDFSLSYKGTIEAVNELFSRLIYLDNDSNYICRKEDFKGE
jgi:hypothetical protein